MNEKEERKVIKKQNNTTWVTECLFNSTITFLLYNQIDIKYFHDMQEYFNNFFLFKLKKKIILNRSWYKKITLEVNYE